MDDAPATPATIAYFSMEVAIDDGLPTYSGGLGVLAGDHLRSAADLGLPVVGVTLRYRDGYFRQRLDGEGHQVEQPVRWSPEERLELLTPRVAVRLRDRPVEVAVWRLVLVGATGHQVPVYLLDTALSENDEGGRDVTDQLYGGDLEHRLAQEVVLGLGGPPLLAQLGHRVGTFHMNEGHSALLALSLLRQRLGPDRREVHPDDLAAVRAQCVFTTHTPVAAGHDRFPLDLVRQVLGDEAVGLLEGAGCLADGELNMTGLGMCASHFVNAVSLRHQQVSQEMFPQFDVASITNGVHATTWTGPAVQGLFDHHVPGWRVDNTALRAVSAIGLDEIRQVHTEAKEQLVEAVARRSGVALDPDVLTIGVARRATPYKRTALLLTDPDRLVALAEKGGPVQVVYAGKAHPRDEAGKEIIGQVVEAARRLWRRVPVVYLEDYSLDLARLLCAGTDLWLNTPTKPYEASGTSGMKAALNGVPSLSVLDGWWIEGHVEGVTGWSVGNGDPETDDGEDASALYTKLEQEIVPLYYERPADYDAVRRAAISLNGSYFTTERMVRQYARRAYHRPI